MCMLCQTRAIWIRAYDGNGSNLDEPVVASLYLREPCSPCVDGVCSV